MVSAACEAAGVGRRTAYDRRQRDEQFAVAWADELERAVEVAEAEIYRRAVRGVEKPVTVAGEREVIREYSDTLLMFLMRARKPEVCRERYRVDHAGRVEHGHAIYDPQAVELSAELRARVRRILEGDNER
jgi:hypothetical protein